MAISTTGELASCVIGFLVLMCHRAPDRTPHETTDHQVRSEPPHGPQTLSTSASDVNQTDNGQGGTRTAGKLIEFPFEPHQVTLEGLLRAETRLGPPNYGETPDVDQRITVYVLHLSVPITAGTNSSLSELNDSPVPNVDALQVSFLAELRELSVQPHDPIVLCGVLSKQQLARDFYPIVLREAVPCSGPQPPETGEQTDVAPH